MNEEEVFSLLENESKKIANWDTILIYFAKRYNDNDLNGLYTLVTMAKRKAELEKEFTTLDLIYFDFFLASILEKEYVGWRAKQHLKSANDKLESVELSSLELQGQTDVAKFYFDLGIHYEKINLAKLALEAYQNSANIFFELGFVQDSQYGESKVIEMNNLLPKEERISIDVESFIKKYGKDSYLSKLLKDKNKINPNSVEQTKKYLDVIDSVEEEIVRHGLFSYDVEKYNTLKEELLKARGIAWKAKKSANN